MEQINNLFNQYLGHYSILAYIVIGFIIGIIFHIVTIKVIRRFRIGKVIEKREKTDDKKAKPIIKNIPYVSVKENVEAPVIEPIDLASALTYDNIEIKKIISQWNKLIKGLNRKKNLNITKKKAYETKVNKEIIKKDKDIEAAKTIANKIKDDMDASIQDFKIQLNSANSHLKEQLMQKDKINIEMNETMEAYDNNDTLFNEAIEEVMEAIKTLENKVDEEYFKPEETEEITHEEELIETPKVLTEKEVMEQLREQWKKEAEQEEALKNNNLSWSKLDRDEDIEEENSEDEEV